jgi:hypothetical protein
VIGLLQHVATKRETERREMLASTTFPPLDELLIIANEINRSIFDQLAANLMLHTPEEIAALKEKIQQLQGVEPDGGQR